MRPLIKMWPKQNYNKNSLTVHNINNLSEETITGARIRPYEKKKLCCIIHKKYKTLTGKSTHFYAPLLSLFKMLTIILDLMYI